MQTTDISITSAYVEVNDCNMHYLQAGEGQTVLFVHGMPTSSFLWRNIIPSMATHAHCVAVDLIGMGRSDKPEIDYTVFDHIDYFEQFVAALGLKNITLVMHGWGSVIGFEYAKRHGDNIASLVFFESHVRPTVQWDMLSLPVQQFTSLLSRREQGYRAVVEQNYLVKKLLPSGVVSALPEAIMEEYERPFQTIESRKLLWQYIEDLPLGQEHTDVVELIQGYSDWLQQTKIPKLMLYAVPGFITTLDTVSWTKDNLPNLTLEVLDDVMHFAQESQPALFAEKLTQWYVDNIK